MVPFQRINGYVAGPGGQNGPSQSIPTPKLVLQLLGRGSIRPEPQNVRGSGALVGGGATRRTTTRESGRVRRDARSGAPASTPADMSDVKYYVERR